MRVWTVRTARGSQFLKRSNFGNVCINICMYICMYYIDLIGIGKSKIACFVEMYVIMLCISSV